MVSRKLERIVMKMEKQVNVRVTDGMYGFLERKAREEDRTVAQVLRRILAKEMEAAV